MVKIYKKAGHKNYFFEINIDGKRTVRSTGTDKKALAQKNADTVTAETKAGLEYKSCLKRLIESIHRLPENEQNEATKACKTELSKTITKSVNIEEIAAVFMKKPRFQRLSESTQRQYSSLVKEFLSWVKEEHPHLIYVNDITVDIAEEFFEHLAKKGCRSDTYNKKIIHMSAIFDDVMKDAGLTHNIWKKLDKMENQSVSKKMFTDKQIEMLFSVAEGDLKVLFTIGLYTGLRLGDAVLLKWDAIDFERNNISVVPLKTKRTHRELGIPIHKVLKSTLLEILRDEKRIGNDYIVPNLAKLYLKSAATLSKRIRKVIVEAGIEPGYTDKSSKIKRTACLYGFHSFRHSFISTFANMGVPMHITMDLVGHNSQMVHRIYQHSTEEAKQGAISKFPVIQGTESE
ncbi:site-specific integrase [bacterium]|nr:site-specific integrase [bacterium]